MIWIIGGTSEARQIVDNICDLDNFVVTCATSSEAEFIHNNLMVKKMDYDEMVNFIQKKAIDLVVDLSHPYACLVSENAQRACEKLNIKYIRYVREKTKLDEDVECFNSINDCMDRLKNINGTVFFTTGSKNIKDFEKIKGDNRFIYRVLPSELSMSECSKNGVKMRDVVGILGPFSADFNEIMFREFGANYVVMKDSGKSGGTLFKIEACKSLNIKALIIGRKDEDGIHSLDVIEKIIRKHT